ncbi:SGNH/GDSL hydrolase family protein [Propionibacteriaceae bacterium Y1923]
MPKRLALIGLAVLTVVALGLTWMALTRTGASPATTGTPATQPAPNDSQPATNPSTPATPSTTPTNQTEATLVILGDGYSAASPWPRYAGELLDLTVVNMAASGTGFHVTPRTCPQTPCTSFKDSAEKVAEHNPKVIVIAGGEVDGDYDLEPDATATLNELQAAAPNATIVFMSPISARPSHPAWLNQHAETLKTVAANGNAVWVDTSSITARSSSYRSGDLTDESSQQIATLLAEGLNQ